MKDVLGNLLNINALLRERVVSDLVRYIVTPGTKFLIPDCFGD